VLVACGQVEERPNLILISIDTLRADRLGCYGYDRDTSPALDRFAREHAVRYANAIAESSWTLPSHVTLLSGLHPLQHGVRLPDQKPAEDVELLAERLQREGYYGFGITDGGWLSEGWGFARGFDSFQAADQDLADTVREATEYIHFRDDKGPWFAFLHTYDVHCPYDPPEPFFSMFASEDAEPIEVAGRCGNPHFNASELTAGQARFLSDRYDGGIRWVDDALAELFRFLDERDAWDNTVVVITSDHGEELGEYGRIGHERTLSSEALRIPLLIAAPGLEAGVELQPTGLANVRAIVLDLLGLEADAEAERSFVVSDLAWQVELASWWTPREHVVEDSNAITLDSLRDAREVLSASAHRAGQHVGSRDDLKSLGYGD